MDSKEQASSSVAMAEPEGKSGRVIKVGRVGRSNLLVTLSAVLAIMILAVVADRQMPTADYLSSVSFAADGQRGWAVGDRGTFHATTNGGMSWQAQPSGTSNDLWEVSFAADNQRGWVVGSRGTILATTNGGTSWQAQTSGTTNSLLSVSFAADGQRGWTVGDRGTILATTTGGMTWQLQPSGTTAAATLIRVAMQQPCGVYGACAQGGL